MKLRALLVEEADMRGQPDLFGEIHEDEFLSDLGKAIGE